LAQAVENTIFDRWGVLSRHFELIIKDLLMGKDNRNTSLILIALSNGKNKIVQLIEDLGGGRAQTIKKVNRLVDMDILVKNGRFLYFKDKLFKYWIKYVFQKRIRDIELAPDKQRKQFKEEFNACIENFKLSSRQDFSSRIVDLFHCFDNEALDLNGRRYKLPLFYEIVPVKLRDDNGFYFDVIKAQTDEAVWLVVMKKDSINESELNAILTESKKSERKPQRCLMITLTNLDENTKLRALQERFWVWNEGELNILLTLFDKPFIV